MDETIAQHLTPLRSDDADTRATAADALAQMGVDADEARPFLERALHDSDESVRRSVLNALHQVAADPKTIVPALREVLTNTEESSKIRSRAVNLLWQVREAGLPTLLELSRTGDLTTRHYCVVKLLNSYSDAIDKEAVLQVLIDALQDEDEHVRSSAANNLFCIGEPAVAFLQQTLESDDTQTRLHAAVALLKIDKDQRGAVEALVAALGDADPGVRKHAASGLGDADGPHVSLTWEPLLNALSDPDRDVRERAAMALTDVDPPPDRAFPPLIRSLREQREDVDAWPLRKWVAYALARYGGVAEPAVEALTETLQEYLDDAGEDLIGPDPGVGNALALALGGIGPPAEGALPLLKELGKRLGKDDEDDIYVAVRKAIRAIRPRKRKGK